MKWTSKKPLNSKENNASPSMPQNKPPLPVPPVPVPEYDDETKLFMLAVRIAEQKGLYYSIGFLTSVSQKLYLEAELQAEERRKAQEQQ